MASAIHISRLPLPQLHDTVTPFILAQFFLWNGLVNTAPGSRTRGAHVILAAICSLAAVRSTIAKSVPGGVGTEYIIGFILHTSNFLLIAKLQPPQGIPWSAQRRWAFNQLIGARWGVSHLPPFSRKDPHHVPTRTSLFFWRLWDVLWLVSAIWCIQKFPLLTDRDDYLNVPEGFLLRLGQMTDREIIIRLHHAVTGYGMQYCTLRLFHSASTCIAMICGQDPALWPPLFGSLADAYTVRRWFSLFWHYLMRKAFTSHAMLLCTRVLRLPKSGKVTRFVVLVTAFMISAIMHTIATPGYEVCSTWPQVRYYLSIIVAIALEDVVIAACKWLHRSRPRPIPMNGQMDPTGKAVAEAYPFMRVREEVPPPLWLRLVGYVWVFCFHIWAGSMQIYGLWAHCAPR